MIYLYCGSNLFLLEEKITAFNERYKAKFPHSLNVHSIDLSGEDLNRLKEIVESRSLFDETALVFVSGVEGTEPQGLISILYEYDVTTRDDVVLVFYARVGAKDLKKDILTFFKKEGTFQEFELYKGARLLQWVQLYAHKNGSSMSREDAELLVERSGEDMLSLSHEIEKLVVFTKGEAIVRDDIEALVPAKYDTDIFRTVDALARKDVARALSLLWEHRKKGDDPFQILAMFAYQIRTLLIIKDSDMRGARATLHPYVIKKNKPLSRAFAMDELMRLHTLVTGSDLAVKTGAVEPYIALEDLILAFSAS